MWNIDNMEYCQYVRYWQNGILSICEILTKWNIVIIKFSGREILTMLNVIIVSFWQCAEDLKTSHPVDDEPTREKSTLRDLFGHSPRFKTNTNKETSAVDTNPMIKSDARLTKSFLGITSFRNYYHLSTHKRATWSYAWPAALFWTFNVCRVSLTWGSLAGCRVWRFVASRGGRACSQSFSFGNFRFWS